VGGSGSYTYVWQQVSGTAATVNSPGSSSTAFNRTAAKALGGNVVIGVYRVQVTDTVTSQVATSSNFDVQTTHEDTT
jgi:hypothetical protein